MRKYLLFGLLLCIQWSAHGQTTYDYRYWFDMDEGNQHTGTSSTGSWNIEADLSGLDCSLHAIHIQVKDTSGVWSAPKTRYFVKMPDRTLAGGNYWFDNDFLSRQPLATVNGKFDVDVSSMSETLHYIHFQANDAAGYVSSPFTSLFMKLPVEKSLSYRYWLDNDQTTMKSGKLTGESMMFDVSDLTDGFHVITLQVDGNGGSSIPANRMFIKIPQTEGVSELTCMCTIDGKVYKQEKVASSGGVVDWSLDVSPLSQGLHRIQVQVFTPSGAATDIYDSFFFRTTMDGELQNMNLVYSIDGGDHKSIKGSYNNGMFHFDMDVASIEDGLHNMTYMLASETGTSTKVNSAFFMKTPVGGPGIISYKYWLNDYEDETRYVKLEERKNPFDLITLLPVDTCPIRSSCFHFEIQDDGIPMVYAKNDIHFQFYDVSNRVAEAHKQYVDYNVGEKIEEIKLLNSGVREYMQKPLENQIYWFKVNAERGDSLAFKTDVAATIQVFAPSCEEVFKSQGSSSVVYGGCHARENGTYYVALHDVTSRKASDITIDYLKIDKYAVLNTTPTTIGCPSMVNINIYGNGFSDSTRVAICKDNLTIWANIVHCESYSDLSAYFELKDIPIGSYDMRVVYTEKDSITLKNHINIEEADSLSEISIAIEGNPFFLAGSSATYELKITNHSNIPVYSLPFTLTFECEGNEENIPYIKFSQEFGKEHKEMLRKVLMLDIEKQYVDEIIRFYYGDNNDLTMFYVHKDSLTGEVFLVGDFVQPCVPANTTITIPFTFKKVNHNIKIFASTKKHWDIGSIVAQNGGVSLAKTRNGSDGNCCVKEALDCVFTLAEYATPVMVDDFAKDCVFGYVKETSAGIFSDILCSGEQPDFSKFPKAPAPILQEIGTSIIQCALDQIKDMAAEIGEEAAKELIKKFSKDLAKKVGGKILKTYSVTKNCVINPVKSWVQGCGGDDGDSQDADPVNSWDPNDVRGYLAESGSKAVKKDQKELYYTIEFENDTAFATASAQNVYLTDTLDGSYLDLESFAPTGLKIGDKKVELDGKPNFVTTVDMRPSINAIAQVECNYDSKTGIAKWHFSSLDPMTMEPVENPMDGFLPINNSDGDGMGEVSFNINLKDDFEDGTEIKNRASIVFDYNDAIITPTWTNIIDATAPISRAADIEHSSDSTAVLSIEATDELSGMWRYDVYVQYGSGAWFLAAENVPADTTATVKIYEGIDHGFYVVATDSAGNVEQKEPMRELSYNLTSVLKGDANDDGRVSIVDVTMTINAILNRKDDNFNAEAADMNVDGRISIVDATMIINVILNK